jgi:NADH-quinone oxidoreductase subunit C
MTMEELKKNTLQKITDHFNEVTVKEYAGNRVDITVPRKTVPAILFYLKDEMGYNHLSHISCVDWIEEKEFELVYILWSYTDKLKLFVHTRVDREKPVMDNIDMIWRQANTYEREIKEMYGIHFEGLQAPEEFLLEDWQGPPPMRRDFDTHAYAMKTFWDRQEARKDAQDVRETITKRTGEELPDVAKKYTR